MLNSIKKYKDKFQNNKLISFITNTKLEASFTVEASFLVPFAFMMFMVIILVTLKTYDESVIEAHSIIARVKYTQYNDLGDSKLKEITNEVKEALEDVLIIVDLEEFELKQTRLQYVLNVTDDYVGDKEKSILKSDAPAYIRVRHFTDNVGEMIQNKGE